MKVWLIILTVAVIWCAWSIHELCGAIKAILEMLKNKE